MSPLIGGYWTQVRNRFYNYPHPVLLPREEATSSPYKALTREEVQGLLRKGAVVVLPHRKRSMGFHSNLFLVTKKGGSMRLVINLKNLKQFIPEVHFKMEGMHIVKKF